MTKESPLDHHIHLHSHEILPGRWLRPKRKGYIKKLYKNLSRVAFWNGHFGSVVAPMAKVTTPNWHSNSRGD